MSATAAWIGLGFVGQLFFSARFLVQWLASERAGRSIVPPLFWALSIGGSLLLLVYAIHRHDPVFILGQSVGLAIYGRNIQLLAREKRSAGSARQMAAR